MGTTPSSVQVFRGPPVDGRKPTMPQNAAGIRTEPPVSVPRPTGVIRAEMATPVPPLDPPGTRFMSYGFFANPNAGLELVPPLASSCILDLPKRIAPFLNRISATGASAWG